MGGNAWSHTGPYEQDLAVAFRQAQEETLARDNHGFVGRSIEELWRDPEWQEYIFTGGTCTVLDFPPHDRRHGYRRWSVHAAADRS
jgi:hypothetical protein